MIVFLDTEFTDLLRPELLSMGLVSLDGREHYVELNLSSEVGIARRRAASKFVLFEGVLDQWDKVANAASTEWEMGRRTGEWLLSMSEEASARVEVAFDYPADFELLALSVRNAGLWEQVRESVLPVNIGALSGSPTGEIAAEECFRDLRKRGLGRHHALADALALRAAYQAVKALAMNVGSA
ncbi:hypothetical protein H5407_17390 [Mitsuaria sp. WAJ17]|uniref:hypothetical protein n=1 Tax=Mitsuaria sp. WAJ17 TaxID=2761452 RepID=UPI0016026CF4|nr:hypothetical protein [Mitsuaria sp. WAJ17]MBB2487006.1 hypothetical protein [Mitsuaria sp. WAJ17]